MLSAIWENLTSDCVIDIRVIRSPKRALRYLVKYLLKPPVFQHEENYLAFLRVAEDHPLVVSFGSFRGHPSEWMPLICECGSIIFIFVCIVDDYEVDDGIIGDRLGKGPP